MEIVYQEAAGLTLWREEDTLVMEFPNPQLVCSSSALNGGVVEGIRAVFNQTCPPVHSAEELPGGSVEAYLAYIAKKRGFAPGETTGLLTAASQQNVAVSCLSFRDLKVVAAATGGIDHNGGRPGDPASYYEENGQYHLLAGTINILLAVNAYLSPPTLLKASITATEAKTSALMELLAPSCYSVEPATGSGTDGIIIASDPAASLQLTDAGHHSKLGEFIGNTVRTAVKKALVLETGFTPQRQLNVLVRLKRFGVNEAILWQGFQQQYPRQLSQEQYKNGLDRLVGREELVSCISCLIHLTDQVRWGLLSRESLMPLVGNLLASVGINREKTNHSPVPSFANYDPLIQFFLQGFNDLVREQVLSEGSSAGESKANL